MIKRIWIIPVSGEGDSIIIPLAPKHPENEPYIITNIEGLGPVSATINITPYASGDGGVFNSSRRDSRNLVITMKLGKKPTSMEVNRRRIYNACPIGRLVAVDVVYEEPFAYSQNIQQFRGYTESIDCDYFGDQEGIQISIVCPNPGSVFYPMEPFH